MRLVTALFALALTNLVQARQETPHVRPSGTAGTPGGFIHLRSESLDVARLLKTHPPEKLKAKIRAQREGILDQNPKPRTPQPFTLTSKP